MKVLQVLGTGCPKCKKLVENAEAAARQAGLECRIEKVTKVEDIIACGVMMTPALVVDGAVKAAGRVPKVEEIEAMLSEGDEG